MVSGYFLFKKSKFLVASSFLGYFELPLLLGTLEREVLLLQDILLGIIESDSRYFSFYSNLSLG